MKALLSVPEVDDCNITGVLIKADKKLQTGGLSMQLSS